MMHLIKAVQSSIRRWHLDIWVLEVRNGPATKPGQSSFQGEGATSAHSGIGWRVAGWKNRRERGVLAKGWAKRGVKCDRTGQVTQARKMTDASPEDPWARYKGRWKPSSQERGQSILSQMCMWHGSPWIRKWEACNSGPGKARRAVAGLDSLF